MRPIDADMLKAEFTGNFQNEYGIAQVKAIIDTMPTIDAEPVRHGHIVKKKRVLGGLESHKCPECSHRWQEDHRCEVEEWLCSECGKVLAENYTNYCPNCGARMDGKGGENEQV